MTSARHPPTKRIQVEVKVFQSSQRTKKLLLYTFGFSKT